MVDRAVTEEAGATPDRPTQHRMRSDRRGQPFISWPEERRDANPERRGQMHGARIARDERVAACEHADQLGKVGTADQVEDTVPHQPIARKRGFYRIARSAIVPTPDQHHLQVSVGDKPGDDIGVARWRPALSVSVGRARRHPHRWSPEIYPAALEQGPGPAGHPAGRSEARHGSRWSHAHSLDQRLVIGGQMAMGT